MDWKLQWDKSLVMADQARAYLCEQATEFLASVPLSDPHLQASHQEASDVGMWNCFGPENASMSSIGECCPIENIANRRTMVEMPENGMPPAPVEPTFVDLPIIDIASAFPETVVPRSISMRPVLEDAYLPYDLRISQRSWLKGPAYSHSVPPFMPEPGFLAQSDTFESLESDAGIASHAIPSQVRDAIEFDQGAHLGTSIDLTYHDDIASTENYDSLDGSEKDAWGDSESRFEHEYYPDLRPIANDSIQTLDDLPIASLEDSDWCDEDRWNVPTPTVDTAPEINQVVDAEVQLDMPTFDAISEGPISEYDWEDSSSHQLVSQSIEVDRIFDSLGTITVQSMTNSLRGLGLQMIQIADQVDAAMTKDADHIATHEGEDSLR